MSGWTKTLYVAGMDCLPGWSKVGITGRDFDGRWRGHNNGFPPPAGMHCYYSVELDEQDASRLESVAIRNWATSGEWARMPAPELAAHVQRLVGARTASPDPRPPLPLGTEVLERAPAPVRYDSFIDLAGSGYRMRPCLDAKVVEQDGRRRRADAEGGYYTEGERLLAGAVLFGLVAVLIAALFSA